jgi:hypothetical protein
VPQRHRANGLHFPVTCRRPLGANGSRSNGSLLGSVGTVLAVALPVGLYITIVNVRYAILARAWHSFHALVAVTTAAVLVAAVLAAAVALAASGVSMAPCLLIVMLVPAVTVVGFELVGHRYAAQAITKRLGDDV